MPRIAEPAVREYVAARVLERARDASTDPSTVRARLQRVLQQYPSGPDVWIGLDRLRAEARRELAALPAEPPAVNGGQPPAVISDVALTWERSAPTEFVATIENLRDVPIEAYGLEFVDPATNRVESGRGADFCVGEPQPAERGSGRIQPHEVREVSSGQLRPTVRSCGWPTSCSTICRSKDWPADRDRSSASAKRVPPTMRLRSTSSRRRRLCRRTRPARSSPRSAPSARSLPRTRGSGPQAARRTVCDEYLRQLTDFPGSRGRHREVLSGAARTSAAAPRPPPRALTRFSGISSRA